MTRVKYHATKWGPDNDQDCLEIEFGDSIVKITISDDTIKVSGPIFLKSQEYLNVVEIVHKPPEKEAA